MLLQSIPESVPLPLDLSFYNDLLTIFHPFMRLLRSFSFFFSPLALNRFGSGSPRGMALCLAANTIQLVITSFQVTTGRRSDSCALLDRRGGDDAGDGGIGNNTHTHTLRTRISAHRRSLHNPHTARLSLSVLLPLRSSLLSHKHTHHTVVLILTHTYTHTATHTHTPSPCAGKDEERVKVKNV